MKIKHKETGKVIELMDGTKFPEGVYDLVTDGKPAADKVADAPADGVVKAKTVKKAKPAAKKSGAKSDKKITEPKPAVDGKPAADKVADAPDTTTVQ